MIAAVYEIRFLYAIAIMSSMAAFALLVVAIGISTVHKEDNNG